MHSVQAYFTGYMKIGSPNVQYNWEMPQLKHPLKGLQQLPQSRQRQLSHFASLNGRLPPLTSLTLHETQGRIGFK
jgi:hypothetical protein